MLTTIELERALYMANADPVMLRLVRDQDDFTEREDALSERECRLDEREADLRKLANAISYREYRDTEE